MACCCGQGPQRTWSVGRTGTAQGAAWSVGSTLTMAPLSGTGVTYGERWTLRARVRHDPVPFPLAACPTACDETGLAIA